MSEMISLNKNDILIVTEGKGVHSPYPWRRYFEINVSCTMEELYRWITKFENEVCKVYGRCPYKLSQLPPYTEYLKSFCNKCHYIDEHFIKCLRHESVQQLLWLIGAESNHKYIYVLKSDYTVKMELGASHWEVTLTPSYAEVVRPNGTPFTYRAHKNGKNGLTSHLYIVTAFVEFVEDLLCDSYRCIHFKVFM